MAIALIMMVQCGNLQKLSQLNMKQQFKRYLKMMMSVNIIDTIDLNYTEDLKYKGFIIGPNICYEITNKEEIPPASTKYQAVELIQFTG